MLFNFYWPALRGKLLVLSLLTLMVTLAIGMYMASTGHEAPWGAYFCVSLFAMLSPLTLLGKDYRSTTAQLPVTAGEKLGTLLLYFWVLFPLSIYAANLLSEFIIKQWLGVSITESFLSEYLDAGVEMYTIYICGWIESLLLCTICIYFVTTSRDLRAGRTIIAVLISYVALMMIMSISLFIFGFMAGFNATVYCDELGVNQMSDAMVKGLIIVAVLSVFAAAFFLRKLYKYLNNSGF